MKAVIMAGGEGTRLRPLTSNQPKPMMPLANRPMMEHIVQLLPLLDGQIRVHRLGGVHPRIDGVFHHIVLGRAHKVRPLAHNAFWRCHDH